jgi:hypothetical protein
MRFTLVLNSFESFKAHDLSLLPLTNEHLTIKILHFLCEASKHSNSYVFFIS